MPCHKAVKVAQERNDLEPHQTAFVSLAQTDWAP